MGKLAPSTGWPAGGVNRRDCVGERRKGGFWIRVALQTCPGRGCPVAFRGNGSNERRPRTGFSPAPVRSSLSRCPITPPSRNLQATARRADGSHGTRAGGTITVSSKRGCGASPGESAQPVEHLALGRERGRGQAREHAEELGLVLVGVPGRERDRDDPPEHARPERVDERRAPVDEDDRVRTGSRAGFLQVVQQPERAAAQLRVGRGALVRLAGDVVDAARAAVEGVQRVGQGRVGRHGGSGKSTIIARGGAGPECSCVLVRLIAARFRPACSRGECARMLQCDRRATIISPLCCFEPLGHVQDNGGRPLRARKCGTKVRYQRAVPKCFWWGPADRSAAL